MALLQIYNIPWLQKKWSVRRACSEYISDFPRRLRCGEGGKGSKQNKNKVFQSEYDECVLAREEWVVFICQRCYYSRQRSYRPISHTIITVISSRSPYSSSQLSTSPARRPKHALTQRALERLAERRKSTAVSLFRSRRGPGHPNQKRQFVGLSFISFCKWR